jgi:hypothetical protein
MAPPGWYADPTRPGTMRWWDGVRWTEQYAPGPAPVYGTETDGYAIAALICGVLGVPIAPIILGVVARNRIAESGGRKDGNGLAIAGIVLGIIQIVIFAIVVIIFIAAAASTSTTT